MDIDDGEQVAVALGTTANGWPRRQLDSQGLLRGVGGEIVSARAGAQRPGRPSPTSAATREKRPRPNRRREARADPCAARPSANAWVARPVLDASGVPKPPAP